MPPPEAVADDEHPSGSSGLFDSDIRATTQAFNTKIQQKKKEQERELDEAASRTRQRYSYIVQAMVGMRKSLREVTRLDLGKRFYFSVQTDDWQGWPRVTLAVVDQTLPDAEYPHFQILGGYREDKAQIDINLGDDDNVLTYNLASETDVRKLSGNFKKSVRSYLDMIGDVILQAERAPIAERPIEQIGGMSIVASEEVEETDEFALNGDIYNEYPEAENLFEELPVMDNVDALPAGWGAPQNGPKTRR